jgi:hypothetical protein
LYAFGLFVFCGKQTQNKTVNYFVYASTLSKSIKGIKIILLSDNVGLVNIVFGGIQTNIQSINYLYHISQGIMNNGRYIVLLLKAIFNVIMVGNKFYPFTSRYAPALSDEK